MVQILCHNHFILSRSAKHPYASAAGNTCGNVASCNNIEALVRSKGHFIPSNNVPVSLKTKEFLGIFKN